MTMIRTVIQLTDKQMRTLKDVSRRQNIPVAELIRRFIDQGLDKPINRSKEEIRARAAAAAGKFRSGKSDISENHDDYLAEIYSS